MRRYQATIGRHKVAVRTVVSLVVALAVGSSATGQWQNWLLFIHEKTFPTSDPEFHKNVGFFLFRLPFLSFLVDWTQLALIILLIVCIIAHYLNGGLRFSGPSPRVDAAHDRPFVPHIRGVCPLEGGGVFLRRPLRARPVA